MAPLDAENRSRIFATGRQRNPYHLIRLAQDEWQLSGVQACGCNDGIGSKAVRQLPGSERRNRTSVVGPALFLGGNYCFGDIDKAQAGGTPAYSSGLCTHLIEHRKDVGDAKGVDEVGEHGASLR